MFAAFSVFIILIGLSIYLEPYRQRMLKRIADRHQEWLVKSRAEIVEEFGEQAGLDFDKRFK